LDNSSSLSRANRDDEGDGYEEEDEEDDFKSEHDDKDEDYVPKVKKKYLL